eukprot:4625788-Pyramimonas_sp.AAC.1
MRNVEASPATPTVLADKPGDDAQPSVKHEDVPPTVPASGPAGEDTKLKKVASSTATAVTTTTPAAGSQEDNPKRKDVTPTDKGAVDIAEKKPSTRLLSDEHPGDASAPQDISLIQALGHSLLRANLNIWASPHNLPLSHNNPSLVYLNPWSRISLCRSLSDPPLYRAGTPLVPCTMVQAKVAGLLTKQALLGQLQAQRAQYMEQVEALQRVLEKQVELTGNNPLRKEMVVVRALPHHLLYLPSHLSTPSTCHLLGIVRFPIRNPSKPPTCARWRVWFSLFTFHSSV